MARNKNQRITTLKIIIFSLIPLVFILLAGEVFARVWLYLKNKDPFYLIGPFFEKKQIFEKEAEKQIEYEFKIDDRFHDGITNKDWYFKLKPGSYPALKRYSYGKFTVNSLGFRGKEFNPADKKGKIRIFCIGDSSTFGAESPDDQTWPARLGYYLNKNGGGKFEVINSGFPAYYSLNYFNLIRHELINYKPDIFIIYSAATELNRNLIKRKITKITDGLHEFLYYRSMLYTLLVEKISSLLKNTPVPMNVYDSKPIDYYLARTKDIMKICKDNNIKLIIVRNLLYARKELFLNDNLPLKKIKEIEGGGGRDERGIHYPGYLTVYRFNELMQALAQFCAEYQIEMFDFRQDFYKALADNKDIFNDDVHLTAKGNDLLGRLVAERMLKEMRHN